MFHVLAHVEARGLAPSCHNPAWIEGARIALGPVTARPLGDDLHVLAAAASTHDVLASVQALAWVFDTADGARRVADRDLAMLGSEDVASLDALTIARAAGPIAEVLRAAAELELPLLEQLEPPSDEQLATIATALDVVAAAAPSLARHAVSAARPLGLRGRAFGRSIVIGVPGIGCPTPEHAAWQAAHEATVSELAGLRDAPFLELERKAIVLLRSRARAAGLGEAHAEWLARLDVSALGSIADVDDPAE